MNKNFDSTGDIANKNIKKVIIIIIAAILWGVVIWLANRNAVWVVRDDGVNYTEYEKAKVIEILEDNTEKDPATENRRRGSQQVLLEILTGRHTGDEVQVYNPMSATYNVVLKEGMKVSVSVSTTSDGYTVNIYNYHRTTALYVLIIVFMVLMAALGGKKGIKSLIGLIFTVISVIWILLPLLLKGYATIPVTMLIVIITTIVSLALLEGFTKKSVSAMAGTILGVLFAGLSAYIVTKIAHVDGFNMNESTNLLEEAYDGGLKISGLFIAGILIGSLGAVMDVAMSIASSVNELATVNPDMTRIQLFKSGMNIGKDAMGTMSNTLILAFAGTSLNMMLLIYSYNVSYYQLMETDFVATEIIQGITGSLGIISAVPFVAFMSSLIMASAHTERR